MTESEIAKLPVVTNGISTLRIAGFSGDYALEDFKYAYPTAWKNRARVWSAAARAGSAVVIGAHVGTTALPAAAHFKQVHAFEPASRNHELLCHNVEFNGIKNVTCANYAFSDVPGEAVLFLCPDERSVCHSLNADVARPVASERVSVTTLDALPIDDCMMLMVDAEGYDLRILQGGCEFLKRQKQFPVIQIEFAPQFWSKCGSNASGLVDFCREFGLGAFADVGNNFSPISFDALRELFLCWAPACQAWLDLYLLRYGDLKGIFPND
jgi:FkbM family methyltransferase